MALPQELLVHILQHVPWPQRLSCAVVCTAWQAAVASMLVHIGTCTWDFRFRLRGPQKLYSCLQQHPGRVASLRLCCREDEEALQLPCMHMSQLEVSLLSRPHIHSLAAAGHAEAPVDHQALRHHHVPVVGRALVAHAAGDVGGKQAPLVPHAVLTCGGHEQLVLLLAPLPLALQASHSTTQALSDVLLQARQYAALCRTLPVLHPGALRPLHRQFQAVLAAVHFDCN